MNNDFDPKESHAPYGEGDSTQTEYSTPDGGHGMVYTPNPSTGRGNSSPRGWMIALAAVALTVHNRKLGIPAMILAVLIAFSRMYLYVHYPTDVLASVILGTGIAFLGCFLAKKIFAFVETKRKPA